MGRCLFFLACAVFAAGCGSGGTYVWFHDLPAPRAGGARDGQYVINAGDTISIRVYEQEAMSSKLKVRADGKVALPFVGDTEVRGKRPSDVARDLETRLKEFVVSPKVTVNVDEFGPITVAVVGEVTHPGSYPLEPAAGVLQALASAGGFTEFASKGRIFVLRRAPALRRIRFTFDALSRNEPRAAAFALQAGDVIVVE